MHHVAISTRILGTCPTCTYNHPRSSNCLLVDRTSVGQSKRLSACADKTRLDVDVSLAKRFPLRKDGHQVTVYGHPCMTLYGHPCMNLYGHPYMTLYGHPCKDARLTFASS